MKSLEKRIDELTQGAVFEFKELPNIEFVFVSFKWREDILEFYPRNTSMLFVTEQQCSDTVYV